MNLAAVGSEIRTPRLLLRPLALADAPGLLAAYGDPVTMRYWSTPPVSSLAEVERMVQADLDWVDAGRALFWAVVDLERSIVAGKCTLFDLNAQNHRAEVGYILAPAYQRRGLMSEALAALFDFSFDTLGLHRIEADTDVDNIASMALLEKLGFQREGLFRERWLMPGGWSHSLMFGLLRSDWEARRRG